MPFLKLDCGILDSSLWDMRDDRDVFITALLMARPVETTEAAPQLAVDSLKPTGWSAPPGRYGFVAAAGPGIVRRAGVDPVRGREALERLGEPDPESRSQEHGGRRMVRVDGGYLILNFATYREHDYGAAERMRKLRERRKTEGVTANVPGVRRNVTPCSHAEADAEGDADAEAGKKGGETRARARAGDPPAPMVQLLWQGKPVGDPEHVDDAVDALAQVVGMARKPSGWASGFKGRPKTVPVKALEAAVVRALREIRLEEVRPERCATAAGEVLALWRALGHPDPDGFAGELVLVARAAQMSSDRIFARDVRAEGWKDGQDRTFSVATLCRRGVWDDRLRAARKWAADTGRVGPGGEAVAKRQRWGPPDPSAWIPLEEPEPLFRSYCREARELVEAELGGDRRAAALGRLREVEAGSGTDADLSAVVAVALESVGWW